MPGRWLHLSTNFALSSNNELWLAWCYQQWPIASTNPKDERGRDKEQERNYLDEYHVPEEFHTEGAALAMVEVLRMPYFEIVELGYSEFVKLQLLHKAISMRRPAKFISEHEYYMNQTRRKHGL